MTAASWDKRSIKQMGGFEIAKEGISQMQKAPNLVLTFSDPRSGLSDSLPRCLPYDTVILGAIASDIQVNRQQEVEHKSVDSAMYASFSDAVIEPFCVDFGPNLADEMRAVRTRIENNRKCGWKAIIVYACGHGASFVNEFVASMQETLPRCAIVGGICSEGYVSKPKYTREGLSQLSIRELRRLNESLGGQRIQFVEKSELVDHIFDVSRIPENSLESAENSCFGVLLGGDAPVRSMVSRGVRSLTQGVAQPSSPLVVQEVTLARPGDDSYMFRGNDLKPIHMITKIHDRETGKTMLAAELMTKADNADFVGLKRPSHDGFELHMMSPYCQATQSYLIYTDGSPEQLESYENAEIDLFNLNGDACLEDMDATVSKLKKQTRGEEILGAIMFSCNGRGPRRGGLIKEAMADANRFSKGFPDVPCLGFYAGGEIGPQALAGNENVFQTGRAAVQGFTAVFALFIVPVVENPNYHLDDCRENVTKFIESRLAASV